MGNQRTARWGQESLPAWPPAGADLVVFDLNRTLIELSVGWDELRFEVEQLARAAGVSTPDQRILPLLDTSRRLRLLQLERAIEATVRRAELRGVVEGTVIAPVVEAAQQLPPWVTVAVLSSTSRHTAELAVSRCALDDRVAVCLGRDDVTYRKPHPEGLIELMAHFSVEPSRTVVVGDGAEDLECAERAGARGLDVASLSGSLPAAA